MTAGDALATKLENDWTTNFSGRTTAVPDVVSDEESGTGVLIVKNLDNLRHRLSTHDVINVQFVDRTIQDSGSKSEKVIDTVQITIRIAERDIDGDDLREGVEKRMLGERDSSNESDTLGGLAGEVKRQLNNIRKGFKEWSKTSHTIDVMDIQNTDARVVFTVELEIIERDVQTPTS